jgi:hypothetical protein
MAQLTRLSMAQMLLLVVLNMLLLQAWMQLAMPCRLGQMLLMAQLTSSTPRQTGTTGMHSTHARHRQPQLTTNQSS